MATKKRSNLGIGVDIEEISRFKRLDPIKDKRSVEMEIGYRMGGGLGNLKIRRIS